MRRRLNREEFLLERFGIEPELLQPFLWPVFGSYELIEDQDGQGPLSRSAWEDQIFDLVESTLKKSGAPYERKNPYFKAVEDRNSIELYEPLTDVPHLFLEFARAGEKEDQEALRKWVAKYGLLGLHPRQPDARRRPKERDYQFDPAGGPGETLLRVTLEAEKASCALTAWEAAVSKDKDHLEEALFGRPEKLSMLEESRQASRKDFASQARSSGIAYADTLLDVALVTTAKIVQDAVEAFAYPSLELDIFERSSDAPYSPELLRRTWAPRNLLGAMYLQFYWLITSAGDVTRCKHCGRFLSDAPPISAAGGTRKPRKDKEFCNSRCRQNYHYHARLKPAREGKK